MFTCFLAWNWVQSTINIGEEKCQNNCNLENHTFGISGWEGKNNNEDRCFIAYFSRLHVRIGGNRGKGRIRKMESVHVPLLDIWIPIGK